MSSVCVKVLEKTCKKSGINGLFNAAKDLFVGYEKVIRINLLGLFTDFTQHFFANLDQLGSRLYTQSTHTITTTSYKIKI